VCLRSHFLPIWLQQRALSIQNEIPSGCAGSKDTFFQTYLSSWSDSFGDLPEPLLVKQSVWDRYGIAANELQLNEVQLSPTLAYLSNWPSFEPHRRHTVEIGCLCCP